MLRKSYVINHYKVSKSIHDYVQGKLHGCSAAERRFFLHVLCSGLIARGRAAQKNNLTGWDDFAVSLPHQTIRAHFPRGFSWRPLKAKGLIHASDYHDGSCRYFQVTPHLFDEIAEAMDRAVMAPDGTPAVNLFDGLAYRVTCRVHGEDALPSSKLMRDALRVLHAVECPINVDAVQDHLKRLEQEGNPLAFQNDKLCAQSMFAGMRRKDGVGFYTPSYSPQSSGRIGELGGGVQTCSKRMKEAAFSGLENVFNYDLRSSQGYVLLQELRLAGIDGTWLAAHLGPGVFEKRAASFGLPKGVYKKCFFSTIMGASHVWTEGEHPGAVQVALTEHCGDDIAVARELFRRVVVQLAPLKLASKQWSQWLMGESCPHRHRTQRREYLENAAGMAFEIDRSRPPHELKREAVAHMLQGQEAAFIHRLTTLSAKYGFVPVSNQHDGLVTLGAVPEEASAEAARLSGFVDAHLEQKSFL